MASPDLSIRFEESSMKNSNNFKFDDLQALLRYSHGKLTETCFLLLNINDENVAKKWLSSAPISRAIKEETLPDVALQIAFSVDGLRSLGIDESIIEDFSDEFIIGMSGDESRSRRLGDIDSNAPEKWSWGGKQKEVPHILLLLYAKKNGLKSWRKKVEGDNFSKAFNLINQLPTQHIGGFEPFGFRDGISQPIIDWDGEQSTGLHERERYSNLMAVGEVVLGYPNEYGLYTTRPLIDSKKDTLAADLPRAEDQPELKDFGRNGSYLVLRQLDQDVPGFWQFLDKVSGSDKVKREQLAEKMVGRDLKGTPLVPKSTEPIPGISSQHSNHFTYNLDLDGVQCPIGAHIRRSNPRTGDLPPRVTGFISRLMKILGFSQSQDEDLVASTRFHRILRRARSYGSKLLPEEAVKPDALVTERGLQFICLAGNILRQFEFVQNAWSMSSKFSGLQQESDPLLGNREPLISGEKTDQFKRPDPKGPVQTTCHLPQFITVRGGGYFFMPGLSALKYIATASVRGSKH